MKTILYNPIFINPQAYYVFPRLTRYLRPDNESTAEPANYIGTIEVKVIAYGDTTLKRTYTNTDSIDLSEFKNTWIRISLFTKVGSCVLGEWKIGNMESDLPYIDPEVLASLKAVVIVGNKTNNDSDRAIVKNLVDASNPFVISNAAFKLNSGYGKYEVDFTTWSKVAGTSISTDSKYVLTDEKAITNGGYFLWNRLAKDSFKVKISNIPNGGWMSYRYRITEEDTQFSSLFIREDGIYTLPATVAGRDVDFFISTVSAPAKDWVGLTITQIPSFEGAFVTDGINDLITSTKTAEEMGITNEVTVVSMIHQIGGINSSAVNYGYTNYFRGINQSTLRNNATGLNKTGIYGYSATNYTPTVINNILGDKNDYTTNSAGFSQLTYNNVFSVEGYKISSTIAETSQVAWYWTIIANKALTTDQINQVIAYFNLDRTLKPDILCNTIKQGITNENHAEFGDKLIDFSGNGRDIQLNNIAWKGDSGIGKYEVDFLDSSIWNSSNSTITSSKIDCKNAISHIMLLYYSVGSKEYPDIPSFKVIKTGADIDYSYIDETGSPKSVKIVDGVNILPASHNTLYSGSGRFCGFGNPGMGNSVTITQIPSHAGGLCLDGVNDFGKVTGMPIYKDYTFIIEREFLNETFPNQVCLVSKSKVASEIENGGAFIVDNISVNSIINPYSFYKTTSLPGLNTFDRQIVFQSKYKYLDKDIAAGTATDSDTLWLGTFRDNDSRFANVAIYSLMSFPYSMSEFLIERQLKKHKLGTLYPDMVEFRPIVKSNSEYQVVDCYIDTFPAIVGNYYPINSKLRIAITTKGAADEVTSLTVNGVSLGTPSINGNRFTFNGTLPDKSPQNINIAIDEYIRFEDIVQPYPVLLRFNDENGNEVSWGGKFRVGSTITRIGNFYENNLLDGLYVVRNPKLNGNNLITPTHVVEKSMVFTCDTEYLLDNNEPKCILSPSRLRIPNSSYKLLGYIPDISGHGNNGVIHNSAYAEGSGVNEDGSYQLDGVDDFVTIPTLSSGGKQVLMKLNLPRLNEIIYDQRKEQNTYTFAILTTPSQIAYDQRNSERITYIDGILNTNIIAKQLMGVTHNIVVINSKANLDNTRSPILGRDINGNNWSRMRIYDFMLFDRVSTDDKIKELNEYVGIEAKVELPPYYWDAYGKTNLDADKATIQQRGVAVGDYDITNYNHAYDKMSGYGGYEFVKFDNELDWYLTPNNNHIDVVSRNGYEITLKNLSTSVNGWYFQNSRVIGFITRDIPFKVKANKSIRVYWDMHSYKISSGETFGHVISITTLNPNEDTSINLRHLTEEELVELDADKNRMYYLLWFDLSTLAVNEEVTIEMLPLYPNGLIYDGVNDYSENANIPALDDFTAIIKREWLKKQGCPLIKGSKVYEGGNGNALLLEWDKAYNFVFYKRTDIMEGEVPENISFITPTNYNGNVITRGSEQDTNGICIAGDGNAGFANMVFYKLILYPKTIPLLQINFLKNLMEKDEIIDLNNPIFIQE